MADQETDDELLAFDLRYRAYRICLDQIAAALLNLYGILWQMSDGNDTEADALYRGIYYDLLDRLDAFEEIELSDDYRKNFLEHSSNGKGNDED